jgi:hypothetical protein
VEQVIPLEEEEEEEEEDLERTLVPLEVRELKLSEGGNTPPLFILGHEVNVRALALKALDQRLHAANMNKSTTPAPAVAPMVASINSTTTEENVSEEKGEAEP